MSIFPLFKFFVFIAQKGVFSFQNIVKDIFLAYIADKDKLEKWLFLDQNHALTNPFGKVSLFRLFEVLVFIVQKGRFFVLEYRKRHFAGLYCLKRTVGKMAIFGPKPWVNPFGEVSNCGRFEVLVFIAQKGVFFCSRIS